MSHRQLVGPLPSAGNVQRCPGCGARIVWARDDRFPENSTIGDLVNVEPNRDNKGAIVLWYEVTEKGKPIGGQWFREIEPGGDYRGDRWSRHIKTCPQLRFPIGAATCTPSQK